MLMPQNKDVATALDLAWVRSQFPSLAQTVNGHPAVFLDGPGGTQVPQRVIDAICDYLRHSNSNTDGAYATSQRTNAVIDGARSAMADFLNCDPDEIVFGANMTTLTFAISRAIGRELGPGDEIVLTLLDHDANFSPWKALEEHGVTIRVADIHEADCTLDMEDLARKITPRTKLVAVGYASNAVGTINDVAEVVRLAQAAGALAYIDAVHYAPHGPIDVRALDCDFLVCSTYKFFGPHMGVLYGKARAPETSALRTKFAPTPKRFPTAGNGARSITSALPGSRPAWITGKISAAALQPSVAESPRRNSCCPSQRFIAHERRMMEKMIAGCWRFRAEALRHQRSHNASTIVARPSSCASKDTPHSNSPPSSANAASSPGTATITPSTSPTVWMSRKTGGFLRIGLVHYNTMEEVERLLAALREIAA